MSSEPLGFVAHDHGSCRDAALAAAEETCALEGLQFTPVRRRTLEILAEAHAAMGAYDLLKRLSEDGFGSQPPVVYRALDFLTKHGFAHKIERLNAYVACAHTSSRHTPVFLICVGCNAVAESDTAEPVVSKAAAEMGFEVKRLVVEAEGLCPACQEGAA